MMMMRKRRRRMMTTMRIGGGERVYDDGVDRLPRDCAGQPTTEGDVFLI